MKTKEEILNENIDWSDAPFGMPLKGIYKAMEIYADQFQSKQSLTDITDGDIQLLAAKSAMERFLENRDYKLGFFDGYKESLSKLQTKEPKEVDPVKFLEWTNSIYEFLRVGELTGWVDAIEHTVYLKGSEIHRKNLIRKFGKTTAELLELYKQSLIQE